MLWSSGAQIEGIAWEQLGLPDASWEEASSKCRQIHKFTCIKNVVFKTLMHVDNIVNVILDMKDMYHM